MMANAPTLFAALLLGLAASGHCLVMCGGISAALGIATSKRADGRARAELLVAYQFGRIASYALAGLLLGGVFGGFIALLDLESVRRALRAMSAAALLLGALVASGHLRDPGFGIGRRVWPRLAPLGRRLLPIASIPRAFAFGMVWGWMPCGFVYTVLLVAALQLDAARGAATMLLFGLGTAPALLAAAFGAQRFARFGARAGNRRIAAAALLASAVLTLAGPWLGSHTPWLHGLLPFDCTTAH
jgi:sulfite exporter TauE/SafE